MIEEDTNWFSKWEEQLPSPDELIPISQSLITPTSTSPSTSSRRTPPPRPPSSRYPRQGLSSSSGHGAMGVNGGGAAVDPATDHLFASGPVPPHFLQFAPVTAMHQYAQIGGAAASVHPQMQMHNDRQVGGVHIGSGVVANGQYESHHQFLGRDAQPTPHHRIGGGGGGVRVGGIQPFVEDLESADGNNGGNRRILTLFPTGDD